MRVLVTRPEPGASATAQRLRQAGHEPVVVELTRIVPIRPTGSGGLEADAVVVTSANGVRHAPASLLEGLAEKPCFAVGEATASAARAAGFRDVTVGDGDGAALVLSLTAVLRPKARVAYFASRVRTPALETGLRMAGFAAQVIEVYDTAPRHFGEDEAAKLGSRPIDAVLVYSRKAAEGVVAVAARVSMSDLFRNTTLLAISPAVAEALASLGRTTIVARRPSEDGLFALLDALAGTQAASARS